MFKYRNVVEINDFIDFLYSQKIIDESDYYAVWEKVSKIPFQSSFRSNLSVVKYKTNFFTA